VSNVRASHLPTYDLMLIRNFYGAANNLSHHQVIVLGELCTVELAFPYDILFLVVR